MKLTNAIKKLTNQGFKVVNNKNNAQFYSASKPESNEVIEFAKNGHSEEITCIRTKRVTEEDDTMTDYFCGIWHDNLSQAIRFVG